ncbi:hypothetical protein BGZ90_011991, partial [Linnemannia elongata]
MSRYPPGQAPSDYPMQNVNVQYNPNANPFDDEPQPAYSQNAPLLLSSGYNNNSNAAPGFAPSPAPGFAPSPYTPHQQPLGMPSPHVAANPFASTPDLGHQSPHVKFDMAGGALPPGTPDTRHYGPAPTAQRRRYQTTKKVKLTSGNL